MSLPRRIGVLSVGNVLMGDDAIGPFLLKLLESRYDFPEHVVLQDLGTPGLGITPFLAEFDAIILLDAVKTQDSPGTVRIYSKQQLIQIKVQPRVSPHDPALVEALLFAELSGHGPTDVLLVGIVPKTCELGCALTPEMNLAIEPAIAAVLAELRRLGAEPEPRPEPEDPRVWWNGEKPDPETGEPRHVPGHSR